ncbi:divalent-cation tolerance protein CutA [Vibrio mytili]|uniref:Cytochrome C biogenesis protein n=1 Tax=Vibrio mytili TaxID=50718 RepID=A0A0C3EBW8_9VIBR|nr:cytochrome C biogenesis protein [Vibrio mytili]
MKKHDYCVVLSTTNTEKNRDQIIKGLLEAKLAACIQTIPIESHYVWQEELCTDHEWLLVIKTRRDLYELVEEKIDNLHDYDVAQIVQVPIVDGLNPYLEWIRESTLSRH